MPQHEFKFFQQVGRDFLANRTRALLADEMRLGKTWQAIAACDQVEAKRVLVTCPAVATSVWKNTFKELSPGRAVTVFGPGAVVGRAEEVVVASYDQVRLHKAYFTRERWDVLIIDEAHYCKNLETERTKAVLGKGGLAWYADRIWFMTGTPAVNHAGDLWPILFPSGITKLRYNDFVQRYCTRDFRGRPNGTRQRYVTELRDILNNFMLRRTKKQVAPELPPSSIEPWTVPTSTELLGVICPMREDELLKRAAKQETALEAALSKLPPGEHAAYLEAHAQDYATARRVNALLKTPHILETIQFEIENNLVDKLVVFGYHREPLELLFYVLKGRDIKCELVYGGTSQRRREGSVGRFTRPTKKGGSRVFIGNILSAGTSIDLSAAHEGIFIEKDWVPGNNQQALDRMGGFKQDMPVTIRDAVSESGVDAQVGQTLARKMQELGWIYT